MRPYTNRYFGPDLTVSCKAYEWHLLLSFRLYLETKQTHNVLTTSLQRRCEVVMLQRRCNDVVATLCVCWENVSCLSFYLKWNYFVQNVHTLSETICLFCFYILFSNMFPKIKFMSKTWSNLCNFYSKAILCNFCLRNYFILFFAEFKLLMFHNRNVKIKKKKKKKKKKMNKQNVERKYTSKLPTLQISA